MDADLLAFQQQGLAAACIVMGRTVDITIAEDDVRSYTGVRTELVVDPGELKPGGFQYKRAFSLRLNDPTLTEVIKPGMSVVDDLGKQSKVISYHLDHLGVRFMFGSHSG